MAAFGKILIFLNLVFALLTGGLIGMVYLTRTNWKASFDKLQAGAIAADASYQQLLAKSNEKVAENERAKNAALNEVKEQASKVEAAKKENEDLQNKLTASQRSFDKDSENVKRTTEEINRSRLEVTQMRDQLTDRDRRITDLEKQLTSTRDEAVNNNLALNSLKERFQNLLTANEELTKQLARGANGGPTTSARATDRTPPPEQVRGTVKAVDGNLATVSLGSDAGVNKDHVLYLFRLSPEPRYLGKLTILSTTPFEAVGRIETNTRSTTIKPGDEVASRIAGLK